MKSKLFVAAFLTALFFCLAAYAGQGMYFDANGNRISEQEYQRQVEANRARQAAHLNEVRQQKIEREKEKARMRQKKWAAKEARKQSAQAQKANNAQARANASSAPSSLDQIISGQGTGATTPPPQSSGLNTFDCYSYTELFSMAEDLYVEYENGKSVPKKILMNGIWRQSEPCGDDGYRIGKRLPHLKDIQWSHNKLNPKQKTGGYRGED